jgi:HAMP domain-containing protein
MNSARRLFIGVFLLAGLASGWGWGWWQAQLRQEAAADRLRRLLQEAEGRAQPSRLFEPRMRAIVRRCLGAPLDAALLNELRRLPPQRFSVFLFDHRGRMWSRRAWGIADPPKVWRPSDLRGVRFQEVPFIALMESLFRELTLPLLRPQGSRTWQFEGWEVALEMQLQGLPGRFRTLVDNQQAADMALWDWRPRVGPERVAGVLVRGCLPAEQRHLLVRTYLAALRRRGHQVWFHDLGAWRGEPRGRPSAIGPASLAAVIDACLRGPGDLFDLDGQQIVGVPFEDRFLLCGLVPTPAVVIPRWWLFLMVAGLALAWRLSLAGSPGLGFPWRLGTTMAVVLGLAVGIPLLLIAWFWQGFAANRTAAAWARSAQEAERHLIEIDSRFPAWLRGLEARLQDWANRFSQELAKGCPPLLPLPPDHPLGERGRAFPPGSPLARLVDETIAMERQGLFDTLFLVSSQGLVLRDLSLEKKGSRRLSLLPRRDRVRQLLCRIERGGDRHLTVVREVLRAPPEGLNWRAWNDLRDTRSPAVARHIAEAIRELLRHSGLLVEPTGPHGDARQETAAVMMKTMPGFLGWDPIRRLASSLGRMISLSMGGVISRGCGFALLGPTGRAEFGAMAFYASTLPEETYLRQVLSDRLACAAADRQVLALALDPNTPHLPRPFLHRRWGRLPSFIVPPRRSWSGRWRDEAGRSFLLVAVRPSQIQGYLLLALLPEARVAEAVTALHRELGLAGLTLALLLGLVGWRLWAGVGRPAQAIMAGLDAIEQRRWTHRIPPLGTGDEWDQLATAFNGALTSLEELAVAGIVQEKLLPQEPVQVGGWRFEGRSVMSSQVGGDYFDALPTPGGCLAFVVGDVAGHGVQAALVMAVMRSGFGAVVAAGLERPAAILDRLNDLLFRAIRQHPMMTMLAGVAHPDGRLVMANAGQVTPLLWEPPRDHPSPGMTPAAARHEPSRTEEATLAPAPAAAAVGTVRPLRALVGLPLGIRPSGRPRAEHELTLAGPVRLILCSDGVIEARNPAGACFTLDGLAAAVASLGARPAPAIIAAVQERLRAFAAGRPWEDDVTVAVLSRE